jgi:hypothetical protein
LPKDDSYACSGLVWLSLLITYWCLCTYHFAASVLMERFAVQDAMGHHPWHIPTKLMSLNMANNGVMKIKITWRFDTDISNCYFLVNLGLKCAVQFRSPDLKFDRLLTGEEVRRIERLVKYIAPKVPCQDGPEALICPEITSELQINGDGWAFKYRWTNGQAESAPETFRPLIELGDYIMNIFPIQDMGFKFPLKL